MGGGGFLTLGVGEAALVGDRGSVQRSLVRHVASLARGLVEAARLLPIQRKKT